MTKLSLKTKNKKLVYSFDIFDTLIRRTVSNPDGIFLIVQEKLKKLDVFKNYSDFLKNNFYNIRVEAQLFATSNQYILNNKNDCNFDNIYEIIKNNYSLNDNETKQLKRLEIETELQNIVPIDENINNLKQLIKFGEKVILISDMYYCSDIIRKFLLKIDDIFKDIEIYTSGEIGKTKTDGTLYQFIKEKHPNIEQFHLGDNKISDVLVAKLNGINAKRYFPPQLKSYEKLLLKEYKNVYSELSVGISKIARSLNNSETFELGCSFAGPMLYGYISWVLEQAQKNKLKHLYFVARDGYVLKEIADIIIEQRNINIQTHYFYSSRIANRIPDKNNIDIFILNFCDELKSLISVEFFAKRLNITIDEMKNFIEINVDTKKHLSDEEIQKFANKIINNNNLKNFIIEKNKTKKDLFIKYIKQEIDLSKNDFAFVELNGTGRTQDNIAKLIYKESNISQILSFFLISLPDMKQNEYSIKNFYSYPEELDGYIELFCRTVHGQTIGYKYENNKIVPILEVEKYEQMEKWGYNNYIDGIKTYTELICKYLDTNYLKEFDINIFIKYYNYFKFNDLDKSSENVIRKIPFNIYGDESKAKESLPRYDLFHILTNKAVCKSFLAKKYHKILKKMALLILILSNALNLKIKLKEIYHLYYRYFLK